MLKAELLEIIANGESSGLEFKRDDIRPEQLAKEVVAMANFQGGRILIGVDDERRNIHPCRYNVQAGHKRAANAAVRARRYVAHRGNARAAHRHELFG